MPSYPSSPRSCAGDISFSHSMCTVTSVLSAPDRIMFFQLKGVSMIRCSFVHAPSKLPSYRNLHPTLSLHNLVKNTFLH